MVIGQSVHMRRAQSVRHYSRPSTAQGADDLGILREDEDSLEDLLRKQLIDKERECDKVRVFFKKTVKHTTHTIRSFY